MQIAGFFLLGDLPPFSTSSIISAPLNLRDDTDNNNLHECDDDGEEDDEAVMVDCDSIFTTRGNASSYL